MRNVVFVFVLILGAAPVIAAEPLHDLVREQLALSFYYNVSDHLYWETFLSISTESSRRFEIYADCTNAHLTSPYASTDLPEGERIREVCDAYHAATSEWRASSGEAVALLATLSGTSISRDFAPFASALSEFGGLSTDTRAHLLADVQSVGGKRLRRESCNCARQHAGAVIRTSPGYHYHCAPGQTDSCTACPNNRFRRFFARF